MPPVRRRMLLHRQWAADRFRPVPRRLAAPRPPRKPDWRLPWRSSHPGPFAALGGASHSHAENARLHLAGGCRSSLPNVTPYRSRRYGGRNSRERKRDLHSTRSATLAPGLAANARIRKSILDNFADLHELIQTRRFGDELGNSEVLEQSLVSPGPGGTPRAHWNAAEVSGASDLAQDVFAGIPGQVQVHQDQVGNRRIRIGPLPADEGQGFASVRKVNQFKWEILPVQRPIEKEDV